MKQNWVFSPPLLIDDVDSIDWDYVGRKSEIVTLLFEVLSSSSVSRTTRSASLIILSSDEESRRDVAASIIVAALAAIIEDSIA